MNHLISFIISKAHSVWGYLIHQGGLILSLILTTILSAIGYPKQIIIFILLLIIIDVLTRWIAEVIMAYRQFTLYTFCKAWKDKVLNSKKLKHGIFLKIIFYTILLYIANQTGTIKEITFGQIISQFIYSTLVILDLISIAENMLDAGFSNAKFLVKYFKKKQLEIMGTNEEK
jgi:hypothetical protein